MSRLLVFDIDRPSHGEAIDIARQIFATLVLKLGITFDPMLADNVVSDVVSVSPRVCKTRLQAAIGIAIADGKRAVDLSAWRSTDTAKAEVQPMKMGFV